MLRIKSVFWFILAIGSLNWLILNNFIHFMICVWVCSFKTNSCTFVCVCWLASFLTFNLFESNSLNLVFLINRRFLLIFFFVFVHSTRTGFECRRKRGEGAIGSTGAGTATHTRRWAQIVMSSAGFLVIGSEIFCVLSFRQSWKRIYIHMKSDSAQATDRLSNKRGSHTVVRLLPAAVGHEHACWRAVPDAPKLTKTLKINGLQFSG